MSDFIRAYTLRYICSETLETLHECSVIAGVDELPSMNAWILVAGWLCDVVQIDGNKDEPGVLLLHCRRIRRPDN